MASRRSRLGRWRSGCVRYCPGTLSQPTHQTSACARRLVGSGCSKVGQIDPKTADWREGNYYGIGGSGRVIANHAPSLRQVAAARTAICCELAYAPAHSPHLSPLSSPQPESRRGLGATPRDGTHIPAYQPYSCRLHNMAIRHLPRAKSAPAPASATPLRPLRRWRQGWRRSWSPRPTPCRRPSTWSKVAYVTYVTYVTVDLVQGNVCHVCHVCNRRLGPR